MTSHDYRCYRSRQDSREDLYASLREKREEEEEEEVETKNEERDETSRLKFLRSLLPLLPRDCVRFTDQHVYATPSAMLADMVMNLPANQKLNEDQQLFMLRFGDVLDTVWKEEQELPPYVMKTTSAIRPPGRLSCSYGFIFFCVLRAALFLWLPKSLDM